jgi:hypothetical protein
MIENYFKNLDHPDDKIINDSIHYNCKKDETGKIPENLEIIWFKEAVKCAHPKEKAFAFLWRDETHLHACAVMEDSDVKTSASGKNDKTWAKGDVMELFFRPPNAVNYFELHLAPNLATLELAIPSVDTWQGMELEELFFESEFECKTGIIATGAEKTGWWGHMKVPFKQLGVNPENLEGASFSVCRYNYNSAWGKQPEYSSTATLKKLNFHQPDLWHVIK